MRCVVGIEAKKERCNNLIEFSLAMVTGLNSKIGYDWSGERPPLPRFFGPPEVEALLARPEGVARGGAAVGYSRRDVWPLVEKELGFAHYHRLFTVHPERTLMSWADFEEKYAAGNMYPRSEAVSVRPRNASRIM